MAVGCCHRPPGPLHRFSGTCSCPQHGSERQEQSRKGSAPPEPAGAHGAIFPALSVARRRKAQQTPRKGGSQVGTEFLSLQIHTA